MEFKKLSIISDEIYEELRQAVCSNRFIEDDKISTIYIHIVPKEISGHDHDKYYVGKTYREVQTRFGNNGNGYKKSLYFSNAIKKYGWDNIKHYIIMDYLTPDQANYFEKRIIKHLKSNQKEYGYNCTAGGDGGNTKPTTPVKQYDRDGNFIAEYDSAANAARAMCIDRSMISFACKHNRCMCGYQWCYADEKITTPYVRSRQKTVYQFTPSWEYIKSFLSPREAEAECGIHRGGVSQACSNKGLRGGYRWSYNRVDLEGGAFAQ